ncbi:hypothetical protein [Clostridium hydrogeniformans]|uniref:hypothetical protein n=1 Tax=Clostridium hydrogeniformans TaxID=349933 RepID=UPI00047F463B|nr:hypothetical protein [Clostridium hydrogeniformans]
MNKKHKGSQLLLFIATIPIAIGIIAVIWTAFPVTFGKLNSEEIYRKYFMTMIKDGYLTSSNKIKLTNELKEKGFKNINIKATDKKVRWGEDINLVIEYDMLVSTQQEHNGYKRVKMDKESIALS